MHKRLRPICCPKNLWHSEKSNFWSFDPPLKIFDYSRKLHSQIWDFWFKKEKESWEALTSNYTARRHTHLYSHLNLHPIVFILEGMALLTGIWNFLTLVLKNYPPKSSQKYAIKTVLRIKFGHKTRFFLIKYKSKFVDFFVLVEHKRSTCDLSKFCWCWFPMLPVFASVRIPRNYHTSASSFSCSLICFAYATRISIIDPMWAQLENFPTCFFLLKFRLTISLLDVGIDSVGLFINFFS